MQFPPRPASFDGFVHRAGTEIVDGSGRPLLLRGMGIGNWMLPEGYMWKFGPGAESPREIETVRALFPWAKSYTDVYDRYGLLGARSLFGQKTEPASMQARAWAWARAWRCRRRSRSPSRRAASCSRAAGWTAARGR